MPIDKAPATANPKMIIVMGYLAQTEEERKETSIKNTIESRILADCSDLQLPHLVNKFRNFVSMEAPSCSMKDPWPRSFGRTQDGRPNDLTLRRFASKEAVKY